VNAPAIQQITAAAASETGNTAEGASAHEWWMQNLSDINVRTQSAVAEDQDTGSGWWMQNLFDMRTRDTSGGEPDDAVTYLSTIFATPRGDGGIFTPRGTLNTALQTGLQPIQSKQDIGFTSDWIKGVFEGGGEGAGIDEQMGKAAEWLTEAFGTPRGTQVPPPTLLPKPSQTPRNTRAGQQSDDAVLAAAMQAALATPRGTSQAVDDKPMAGAFNKMFKQQV